MPTPNHILDHGDDNDGIQEYDNPLPAWWLALFALCVLWGVAYAVDYHFVSKHSQAADYDAEIAAAQARWPVSDGPIEVVVTDETVAAGAAIYQTNCVACHAADLTGGIGPSLVDDEWLHGGQLEQIVHTVTNGVPAKGMIAWGPIIGDAKVASVSAFVFHQGNK